MRRVIEGLLQTPQVPRWGRGHSDREPHSAQELTFSWRAQIQLESSHSVEEGLVRGVT